ncbi:MAG: hypothetical protein HQ591_03685 [candidate division Zixibacteria bacterium]|nr:hypothetical protein [Candidatus Tariuqbacter arcticus]
MSKAPKGSAGQPQLSKAPLMELVWSMVKSHVSTLWAALIMQRLRTATENAILEI